MTNAEPDGGTMQNLTILRLIRNFLDRSDVLREARRFDESWSNSLTGSLTF